MQQLLRIELRVPGEYRDVWLYKERLHVWDREGNLRFIKLDSAIRWITKIYGKAVANLAHTLIFRNDWKVGEQFTAWMHLSDVSRAVLAPFGQSGIIQVELPEGLFTKSESTAYSGLVLDTCIYANRVYLATSEGLLESYINARRPEAAYDLNQQTDFRASRVAAKYSAINVSAEDRGLHFSPLMLWSEEVEPAFMKGDWRQVADFSFSSSFARRNLLNYTKSSAPMLLRSKIEEHRSERARFDDATITGYEPEATDITQIAFAAASSSKRASASGLSAVGAPRSDGDFEVLGNSDYHLLASWENQLAVVDLRADYGRGLEVSPNKKFRNMTSRTLEDLDSVLATYAINGGFVVEFYDRVDLITPIGSFPLAFGEAAKVRTFESSKRHKEAIAIVQEDSTSLFGFYVRDDASEDEPALFARRPF